MNKILYLGCLLLTTQSFARDLTLTPPPPRYDADLFHQSKEGTCFTDLEFLYWTGVTGGLDYAQKMQQPAPAIVSYAIGKSQSAQFSLGPGFRVATGYYNTPKYWEVKGQYTYLATKGKDRAEAPSDPALFLTGTWPQLLPDSTLKHAHSHIGCYYNVFELTVDRVYITNPHLRLRVLTGMLASWIREDWRIQYFDALSNSTSIHNRWHFVGGGLTTGCSADWYWGNHIYIGGCSTVAILIGRYRDQATQSTVLSPVPVRNSDYIDTRPVMRFQAALGPSWQQNLGCDKRTEVFVGYEVNVWFNLQEIRRSTSGAAADPKETWLSTSLFALQGLTGRWSFNF